MALRFKPPDHARRTAAIGLDDPLPEGLRRAFEPGENFQLLREPGPSDWLASHPEPGQTFEEYACSESASARASEAGKVLYLQPIGSFRSSDSPPLDALRRFAEAFLSLETRVLPAFQSPKTYLITRQHPATGRMQFLPEDIMDLLIPRLPENAFALLGVTMADLRPAKDWHWVFGQASRPHRVGVYSFARYSPVFYGEAPSLDIRRLTLLRSCRALAHEISHLLGIEHCTWYRCLMNGAKHLADADPAPMHLCPVDLRKLQWRIGFDVIERYRRLADFYREWKFGDEAGWIDSRLRFLTRTRRLR